jgi:shikimate kinase
MKKTVLIVGPKHSGKSQCACALGKLLGWEVIDLDELVEKQTGKCPRALYKEEPAIFMKAETEALASLVKPAEWENPSQPERANLVIAAGGGLIDNHKALALLPKPSVPPASREIILVCLDVSPETAWQRILDTGAGGELPPFLNTENPRETHLAIHERRAFAYKSIANITVSAENKSPEEAAMEIADRLKEYFCSIFL